MAEPEDPPRLLDEVADADTDLRTALLRVRANVPDERQIAVLSARLGILPAPPPPAADGSANGAASLSGKGALALAGGAIGVVALALALLRSTEPTEPGSVPVVAVAPAAASLVPENGQTAVARQPSVPGPGQTAPSSGSANAPPVASNLPGASSDEAPAPAPRAVRDDAPPSRHAPDGVGSTSSGHAPSIRPATTRSESSTSSRLPEAPASTTPPNEAALLGDAKAALESDPGRALALTEAHHRYFPRGAFSQEREFLAIAALVRLGRSSDAEARAERFRSAYPSSPYLKRIDGLTKGH